SLIPGLNQAGRYLLQYRVCEVLNPTNCDTAYITIVLEASEVDLSITKTSNDVTIWEGDEFEYVITVSNIGLTDATDVVIIDNLPNGLSFVGESSDGSISGLDVSFSIQGNRLTWTLPNFPAGAVIDIRLQVRANSLVNGSVEVLTNTVSVSSEEQDVDQSNNTDTDVNRINPFFIPNVITPGEDGKNDRFVIKGIGKFVSNNIVIFNRYGDHVY
ncbi:gliding motility-associated C-terminal domain-containing protein, partial [Belliella sp. R4-6]